MPDIPEDGTRLRPPESTPPVAPTGSWNPTESDPSAVNLAVPTLIGRFEIKAVLGTGTYGRVFLAFDPELHRQVAIKQPHGEGLRPEFRDDFTKEARATAAMDQHANICPIYEVGTSEGVPYLVMRFVAGGTLKNYLDRRSELLPARSAALLARKIALGLSAAHAKGIIHRDLKPANVLVDDANGEVLITDFGLARITSRAQAAASLQRGAHGTPLYMPPEQWGSQAFGPITPVADVYSLGVILFEMLTGQVPFSGSPFELMSRHCTEPPQLPSSLRRGLDPRIDAIALRALEKQPTNRYRSAREFADALNDYLRRGDGELLEAFPFDEADDSPPLQQPEPQWRRDHIPNSAPANRPEAAPQGNSTASLPDATIDEKEVVRCPKCKSRLEITKNRTKPIDCPMCELKFAVDAGRQAAARSSRGSAPPAPPPPAPPPTAQPVRNRDERRDSERDDRRPRREERRDSRRPRHDEPREERRVTPLALPLAEDQHEDDLPPQKWVPAANGLRLAWIGMLISALCVFLLVGIAVISLGAGSPSKSSPPTSPGAYPSTPPAHSDRSDYALFHVGYTLLGVGLSIGIFVTGIGRIQAARVPEGVGGSTVATISALAAWLAAVCMSIPFILIHQLMTGPSSSLEGATIIATLAAIVLLLISEFASNAYLSTISKYFREAFPRHLLAVAKWLGWALLALVLVCCVAAGIGEAADSGSSKPPLVQGLFIIAGASMCLLMCLAPFWSATVIWLNVHAAVAVARHSHSRE